MYPPRRSALLLLAAFLAAVTIAMTLIAAQPPLDLDPDDWITSLVSP